MHTIHVQPPIPRQVSNVENVDNVEAALVKTGRAGNRDVSIETMVRRNYQKIKMIVGDYGFRTEM